VLIAWLGVGGEPQAYGVFVQRIAGDGSTAPGWPTRGTAVITQSGSGSTQLGGLALAPDGGGGAFVYFHKRYSNCPVHDCITYEYWASRRITPEGLLSGWNVVSAWYQYLPLLDGIGRHVLVFVPMTRVTFSTDYWPGNDIHATLYSAAGAEVWTTPVTLAPNWQYGLWCAADNGGALLVAWIDPRDSRYDIYGLRLDPEGSRSCGWRPSGSVVCSGPGERSGVRIVPDGSGGGLFTWQDQRAGNWDVYAVRMTAAGATHADWAVNGNPICNLTGDQTGAVLVSDGALGAIVAWDDRRNGEEDIYAQRVTFDAPTPAALSLVSAAAEPGRARLVWHTPEGAGVIATVYRRDEASDWAAVGSAASEASGRILFQDSGVEAGRRYGYRLGVHGAAGEEFVGETWVQIPAAYALALAGLRPNPATRECVAAFTLPSAAPAMLQMVDIAGRKVASHEVGALGPGNHTIKLGAAAPIPAGVYFLRLTQGKQTITARACVVR
jgi:hypothetical protein